jgi:sulfur carrier protein
VNGGITAPHDGVTEHQTTEPESGVESRDEPQNETTREHTRGGRVPTIVMRIPKRQEIALEGRRQVGEALRELGIAPETVLVIKGNRLLTRDAWIEADDTVEVRPVMSGG